jgi:two-component system NtrC family sensor kinase
MKKYFKIILLLLLPAATMAQNKIVNITPGVFNENGQYFIVKADGWLFKRGNDTVWARKDIDTKSWQKMSPEKLSAKNADKNGRAEGWFRLKIKIGDTFTDGRLGIKSAWWAAEDIYVDGQLITCYGNTGVNGKPFREGRVAGNLAIPIPINFKQGTAHTIAVHFVDYVAPLPPFRLKSEDAFPLGMVSITREGYNFNYLKISQSQTMSNGVWVSVCTVLCLLFWLLYLQNQLEKNLKIIAVGSTFLALNILMLWLRDCIGMPYLYWFIFAWAVTLCIFLTLTFILLILVSVFGRRITNTLKMFVVVFFIGIVIANFLPPNIDNILFGVTTIIAAGLNIYYIVSSWKSLKGPQWAIVAGLMVSLFCGVMFACMGIFGGVSAIAFIISLTGYSLSFPLSLLVYVSMRFKEIITDVRANAAQVMLLSEEKELEALNRQKVLQEEVNRQTAEIRTTLDNLKAAQTQLIQSEKMASLGELTAGIAHEIQNPLNFVNNFSEVNKEMLEELKAESIKPKAERDGQLEIDLINDLIENESKINHHGRRADFIVKGMLEHSRAGTGERQPTDLNVLCDEFMKLSYHGLRAKDKNFNAELVAHFDDGLPKVNVSQQDIGRVLLNLFNNAFYAINQKQKTAGADYKPEVSVTTKSEKGHIIIKVKDNGNGIPDAIKDKIMQPFFTTKPTGEGTGLGLSLSYDIVVKGHGGTIKVNSMEGEGSEFIIRLPII